MGVMSSSHEVARHWRNKKQEYALQGEVCPHCEAKIFPPGGLGGCCGTDSDELYKSEVVDEKEVPLSTSLGGLPVAILETF